MNQLFCTVQLTIVTLKDTASTVQVEMGNLFLVRGLILSGLQILGVSFFRGGGLGISANLNLLAKVETCWQVCWLIVNYYIHANNPEVPRLYTSLLTHQPSKAATSHLYIPKIAHSSSPAEWSIACYFTTVRVSSFLLCTTAN